MKGKLDVLAAALSEQKAKVSQLLTERRSGQSLCSKFPVKSDDELAAINEEVKNGLKEAYVSS